MAVKVKRASVNLGVPDTNQRDQWLVHPAPAFMARSSALGDAELPPKLELVHPGPTPESSDVSDWPESEPVGIVGLGHLTTSFKSVTENTFGTALDNSIQRIPVKPFLKPVLPRLAEDSSRLGIEPKRVCERVL